MVVIGPLSIQQQGSALPPFSKVNVNKSVSELQGNGSGFNVPVVKQEQLPQPALSKQAHSYAPLDPFPSPVPMDYESLMLTHDFPMMLPTKHDDSGDYPQPMSLKYAELYSVPMSSQYPELYMNPGQYDETLFPVNMPNVIPKPSSAADFKQPLEPQQPDATNKYGGSSEMDSDDLDLYSLLTLPAPADKEADVSFANDSNPFNLYGFQPEELDLLDPALLDPVMPDNIHYWNGVQKDSNDDFTKQPNIDPVMTGGLPMEDKCEGEHAFHTSATLESILFLEGAQALSPVHSELSVISEDSVAPSSSPAVSEKWGKGLRDLFERTFDISDIEGDYMLPPPNKRQEASNKHWELERKPELSSPSASPPPLKMGSPPSFSEPMVSSPSPPEPKSKAKNKPKPTLLFGKHEGEIIHKLLVANNNAKTKSIARDKLITIPVEEFNQLLEDAQLSEIEVAFMKEWRRRGKNKAAAQVARKRKREEVTGLDEEVEKMRQQKVELEKKHDQLKSLVESLKKRSAAAENRLYQKQSANLMEPVSRNTHLIHITEDDKLLLIPKISSKVIVVNS